MKKSPTILPNAKCSCLVMGILNVTPDSFYDGGKWNTHPIEHAVQMWQAGASIIDVGGESTRPGYMPVTAEVELERVLPVIKECVQLGMCVSIDTRHAQVATAAVQAGASIVNCVDALDETMRQVVLSSGVKVVARHRDVQTLGALEPLSQTGQLIIDPMIGFTDSREEDVQLIRAVPHLAHLAPVLIGVSHKRIVEGRLGASVAVAAWCAHHGASIVRVHEVAEMVAALTLMERINGLD